MLPTFTLPPHYTRFLVSVLIVICSTTTAKAIIAGYEPIVISEDITVEGPLYLISPAGITIAKDVTLTARNIVLDAGTDGQVTIHGTINTKAATGGNITILGRSVYLGKTARLDASGAQGGGTILIGSPTDAPSETQANQTAQLIYPFTNRRAATTTIEHGALLNAKATAHGSGGRIIVWSDHATRYHGHASVRGGPKGGNGGFIEISSRQQLAYQGTADLLGPQGSNGKLLLDPDYLIIDTTGADDAELSDNQILAGDSPGATFTISASEVVRTLATGDVELSASKDVEVLAAIDGAPQNVDNHLLITAGRDYFQSALIHVTGTGNITIIADRTANFDEDAVLKTNGGDITVKAHTDLAPTSEAYTGIAIEGAQIETGTGKIHLIGYGGGNTSIDNQHGVLIEQGANILSTGTGASAKNIVIQGRSGTGASQNVGVLITDANTLIQSVSGDIQITGRNQGAGAGNINLMMRDGAVVKSVGTSGSNPANITLDGTTTGMPDIGTDDNVGIEIKNTDTTVQSIDGHIAINAEGSGSGSNNHGLIVADGAKVLATGNASITVDASDDANTPDPGNSILFDNGDALQAVGNGYITLLGTGNGRDKDIVWEDIVIGKSGGAFNASGTIVANDVTAQDGNYSLNIEQGGQIESVLSLGRNVKFYLGTGTTTLLTEKFIFQNATTVIQLHLNGTVAGTDYDQITVFDLAVVSGATLDMQGGYSPDPSDVITIIDNQGAGPIFGIFDGLSEGALIDIGGVDWIISYVGGDGNDVTLVPK